MSDVIEVLINVALDYMDKQISHLSPGVYKEIKKYFKENHSELIEEIKKYGIKKVKELMEKVKKPIVEFLKKLMSDDRADKKGVDNKNADDKNDYKGDTNNGGARKTSNDRKVAKCVTKGIAREEAKVIGKSVVKTTALGAAKGKTKVIQCYVARESTKQAVICGTSSIVLKETSQMVLKVGTKKLQHKESSKD
ncbi:PREDICTED: uncharacterized protein LOC109580863 [Amphimedon queenslandica]|uniref:Uncharacterized protein n=1 Tax=Amphimedon queenslandica TaxID=400682 RepID=A0A1X7VB17_AMPQE|nr:PREDICTED: uncharacterized protein LOC109580863 [Amphimedon queenslandica]|eukprot:XP_019849980.1 PREDICTED: uncharacterized protein LOC109580863 [Amphimedon queenslandica]